MSKEKQIEEMFNDVVEAEQRYHEYCLANICHACEYYGDGECDNHIRAEYLYNAGYRKQSENVIELPCKIGETMYVVSRYYTGSWEIFKCKVDSITMYGTNTFISLISVKGNFTFGENVSSINKSVFFAEEEAEKALAKMKGGAE